MTNGPASSDTLSPVPPLGYPLTNWMTLDQFFLKTQLPYMLSGNSNDVVKCPLQGFITTFLGNTPGVPGTEKLFNTHRG